MTNEAKNKILIVAAHPDDEVLGCGGIMAKYAETNEIYVAILAEGISCRYTQKEREEKSELLNLQKESREVGKFLGIKENLFFDLPDNQFDTVPFLKIVKKIEEIIQKVRPGTIYTHYSGDLNIDHRLTFQATVTAARPVDNCPVKEIYSFEILSSTEWSFQKIDRPFSPNVFEDISSTIEKKLKAMEIYKKELREFPYPRSLEGVKILAKKRGMEVGLNYAEAFELVRNVK